MDTCKSKTVVVGIKSGPKIPKKLLHTEKCIVWCRTMNMDPEIKFKTTMYLFCMYPLKKFDTFGKPKNLNWREDSEDQNS